MPYADYQKHLAKVKEYVKTPEGKAARYLATKNYREKNRHKLKAHNAINKAILRGKLEAWPVCAVPECDCTKVEAHHAAYSLVLDVTWLCDKHHKEVHQMAKDLSAPTS